MLAQNELWQRAQAYWQSLAERERLLLKALAAIVVVWLAYQVIWQPPKQALKQAEQRLTQVENQWLWLNEQTPIVQALKKQTQPNFTQSQWMAELQKSLRDQNLLQQAESIKPINQAVQVQFNQVEAPKFFRWLSGLESRNLVADKMQIDPLETGIIKVTLSFKVSS